LAFTRILVLDIGSVLVHWIRWLHEAISFGW
jgi:hypothetical protein